MTLPTAKDIVDAWYSNDGEFPLDEIELSAADDVEDGVKRAYRAVAKELRERILNKPFNARTEVKKIVEELEKEARQ